MARILHILPSVSPAFGGPVEGVLRISAIDKNCGHTRSIVTLDLPDEPWVKECPIEVFAMGQNSYAENIRGGIWKRYGYTPHLVPWLRANCPKFDAVVVNGLWNYASFAAREALSDTDIPYFVFPHGMLDPWFRRHYPHKHLVKQMLWWWSEGKLLRNARAVLFTTEEERLLARGSFFPYKVKERVVGYGTSDAPPANHEMSQAFAKLAPALRGRKFLLFLSRIHEKKGCDLLIDAFAEVCKWNPDIDLVMAGPDQTGLRSKLEEQAKRLGIADRIHWVGMVRDAQKWGAYYSCEAFILPSHQENFGIVVAEAMACGKPVLISNKVNIWREVLESGGGIVAADTVSGARMMMAQFLALTDEQRRSMGQAARACFLENFDLAKSAQRITGTIREYSHVA